MNDVVAEADVDDANDDVSWLRSLLESRRPKPGPVVGRWALGIGDLVANHPVTPRILRGLTRKLNHFGGVAISEESVEFDGDDVKWSDHHRDRRDTARRCAISVRAAARSSVR